jgi:hypothetical protein
MKNIKKIYLDTITLVIVGLLITSTASVIAHEPKTNENKITTQLNKINIKPSDSTYSRTVENKKIYTQPSNKLGTNIFTGVTPAISNSGTIMAAGFHSLDNANVFFSGSTDAGSTWTNGAGWTLTDEPSLPCIDGCGNGRFIGGMVPNFNDNDGSALYKVNITDASAPTTGYKCVDWVWNSVGAGYTNFIDVACGGYTPTIPADNGWALGGHSIIGDHGLAGSQTPFFSYQSTEAGNAWIYRFTSLPGVFNGATSTSMDIDQNTLYSYAVWNFYNNNGGNMDIFLFIMDFGTWGTTTPPQHENNWGINLTTPGNDNKLDVSAYKDNVIIVSERDGKIIAYYVDGASIDPTNITFSEATITTAGKQPRISHYAENKAVCEFIKDGGAYSTVTEDGGATWSTPTLISVESDIQNGDVCTLGYAYESDNTIYFAPTEFKEAVIGIQSVSGGIGVSAVIKNSGTAAAENVNWSIVTTGTVFLGGQKSDKITSLQPGDSTTIKTGLMLGFGSISVTVTAGSVSKTVSGKLLLFYVTKLA